jgi:hypothetical protein
MTLYVTIAADMPSDNFPMTDERAYHCAVLALSRNGIASIVEYEPERDPAHEPQREEGE